MDKELKFKVFNEFPKYVVGDDGSVWSLDYNHTGKKGELSQYKDRDGYMYVFLVVNSKRYKRLVHRMVVISFKKNIENKPQVNHINGKRDDNRLENLEWCTSKENCIHAYRVNGRKATDKQKESAKKMFSGTNNPKAKVNEGVVASIRTMRSNGATLKSISDKYSISVSQVSSIANNKYWKQPD